VWTQDPRAATEDFWRNLYVGVYGSFGILQGEKKRAYFDVDYIFE
jgi:hypothetical protein